MATGTMSSAGAQAMDIPQAESQTSYARPTLSSKKKSKAKSRLANIHNEEAGPSSSNSNSSSAVDPDPDPSTPKIPADKIHPFDSIPRNNLDFLSTSSSSEDSDSHVPLTPSDATSIPSRQKGKAPVSSASAFSPRSSLLPLRASPLGPSMLAAQEYTSINLNSHGDPDEPPRLITYTKNAQGFTWNEELFLPSYMIGRYSGRGARRKQFDADFGDDDGPEVAEIFVTDEEAEMMMP